jgi:hypothetical protein
MFSLRVFQTTKGNVHTNTHVKDFTAENKIDLVNEDLKNIEKKEECIFQVYPINTEKNTFYTLPKGHGLYLYDLDSCLLIAETKNHDQYIYFKLLQREKYRFVLITAESVQKSRLLFAGSYMN